MKTLLKIFALTLLVLVSIYGAVTHFWLPGALSGAMEKVTGAEVNIANTRLGLFPLSLQLERVQLTDPGNPANNQLQLDQANADVAFSPLLSGSLVVEDLRIEKVRFDVPRQSPGQVYRQPDDLKKTSPFADLSVPDVDTVLNNTPLKTTQAIAEAKEFYAQQQKKLEQDYQQLPTKEALQAYETQFKQLKDVNYRDPAALLEAKEKFNALKTELRADKEKITRFYQALSQANQGLSQHLNALKQAPNDDYQLLQGLLSGDAAALEQLTQSIFGPEIAKWSQHLLTLYRLLPKSDNKQVASSQPQGENSLPSLWIKQSQISLLLGEQEVQSQWQNVSSDNSVINKPATYSLKSEKGNSWQALQVDGQAFVQQGNISGEQHWQVTGLKVQQHALLKEDKLAVSLNSATLHTNGKIDIKGNHLSGHSALVMPSLAIEAEGSNKFTQALATGLSNLQELTVDISLGGTITQPQIGLSSNLDTALKQSLLSSVSPEQNQQLTELKAQLEQKAAAAISSKDIDQWQQWQQQTGQQQGNIDKMLQSQLNGALEQEKQKLLNKLKGKLFN